MCPSAGIGKEHLNIPRPDVFAIGLIGRANIAGDAAHHIQKITFIETRRRKPFAVVNLQTNFGKITRRTCGGSSEDDILHPAATHGSRAVLAHDPAQRLQQI